MRRNDQGQDISEERRRRKNRPVRDFALSLLERSDKTAQEMRQKLREREYQQEEIEETLAFLEEYHYVDDEEYVRRYIRSYGARKSVLRIRTELEKRGISRERIDAGLEEIPVDEEAQIADWIRKKGYDTDQGLEPHEYRKLAAALGRRGYSFDMINKVTKQMCEA